MALKSVLNRERTRDVRRQQILEATLDSIAENGLSDTTLAKVAAKAGLSQASLVFYFKTKDALLTEALRSLSDQYDENWKRALAGASDHPMDRICALVESYFHPGICSRNRIGVWFAFWGEAKAQPTYLTICGDGDRERCDAMEIECSRLLALEGEDKAPAGDLSLMIDCLCDGLIQSLLINYREFRRKDAIRIAFAQLARLFPDYSDRIADHSERILARGGKKKSGKAASGFNQAGHG